MQGNKIVQIFCSYALSDETWCQELEKHLSLSIRQGFFTLWHRQLVSPGDDKQQVIDAHLEIADVILLLISADFLASDYCCKEMDHALMRHQQAKILVIPIVIRPVPWEGAPFAHLKILPTDHKPLSEWEHKDAALAHVASHLRRVIERKLTGDDATLEEINPYKGLFPYGEQDAAFFFGREAYIQELHEHLQIEHRFLLLLGPNSSGKTSLVQAGLIPLLRRHGLRGATCADFVTYTPQKPLLKTWLALSVFDGASTPLDGLARWRATHPLPARLVFVVDALEELFHCAEEAERRQFVGQLVEIIQNSLATLILVMRDDYYSDLASYETLIQYLETQTTNIPRLTSEMARAIIQNPARIVGLKIENSLVNTMTDDTMSTQAEPRRRRLHRHSSVLPLLSYTLDRLYQQREDFELNAQLYHDLGGIAGGLPDQATETYQALPPGQKDLARRIFTDLVALGDENNGVLDQKQEKFLGALSRNEQELPAVRKIVEHFAKDHLLEIQYDAGHHDIRVGMIHETLLHEWPLLQDWLGEDRQFLLWHRTFSKQAERWDQLHAQASEERATEALLRESELLIAQGWYTQRGTEWTRNECLFLDASQKQIEQKKERQRISQKIEQDRQELFAQTLAMQALLLQEQQPDRIELSILLAAEAMRRQPSFEATKALKRGLQLLPESLKHIQRTTSYTKVVSSMNGSHIVAAGEEGLIRVRYDYDETSIPTFNEFTQVYALALSTDGTSALVVDGNTGLDTVWIVDLFREQPHRGLHHSETVVNVFCRDHEVITVTERGKILCWCLADGSRRYRLSHANLTAVSISSDESSLATASRDGTVKLWDLGRGICLETIGHGQAVNHVAFHPDRALLVTATDNDLFIWDWETKKHQVFLAKPRRAKASFKVGFPIFALGFGESVLIASDKNVLHFWNFDTEQKLFSYELRTSLQTLLVQPGDHLLASAEENGTVLLWDLTRTKPAPTAILPHPGTVYSLCFHPFKPYLATASRKGGVRLWKYGVSKQLTPIKYFGTIGEMGFDQRKETPLLQLTLKASESARGEVWTIAPGDILPDIRAKSEQETTIPSCRVTQSLFPASIWREMFSKNNVYKVVRSEKNIELFQAQGERFFLCATHHHSSTLSAIAISSDGSCIAFADEAHTLSIWDWQQQSPERLPWGYPQQIRHLIFCDDHSLLSVSEENSIGCWDFQAEKVRYVLPHSRPVNGLEVHPDGHSFLTVSDDTYVRMWSCEKGEPLSVLSHLAPVQRASFSPTSQYVITVSADSIIHVWEATTGHHLAELEHDGEITHVALSADESYLATASRDQHIRLWHWTSDKLFEQARHHMTRNLTPEEWLQYLGNIPYEETFLLDWRAEERTLDE